MTEEMKQDLNEELELEELEQVAGGISLNDIVPYLTFENIVAVATALHDSGLTLNQAITIIKIKTKSMAKEELNDLLWILRQVYDQLEQKARDAINSL